MRYLYLFAFGLLLSETSASRLTMQTLNKKEWFYFSNMVLLRETNLATADILAVEFLDYFNNKHFN